MVFSPHPAISWSISCSVGMKGIFFDSVVFGWVPFSSCHDDVVAVGFGDDFFSSFAPRLFGDDFFDLLWVVEVGAESY